MNSWTSNVITVGRVQILHQMKSVLIFENKQDKEESSVSLRFIFVSIKQNIFIFPNFWTDCTVQQQQQQIQTDRGKMLHHCMTKNVLEPQEWMGCKPVQSTWTVALEWQAASWLCSYICSWNDTSTTLTRRVENKWEEPSGYPVIKVHENDFGNTHIEKLNHSSCFGRDGITVH